MALQTISESVYVGLCLKIGTQQQVVIRREGFDIRELLSYRQNRKHNTPKMVSGSRREGFMFEDSDLDIMIWTNDQRVVWDFSQVTLYNTHIYGMILCDTSESPPGFTLLWLPLERTNIIVSSSCVRINGSFYISSAKYRDNTCSMLISNSTVHGPCSSGIYEKTIEYDNAYCFVSDFWPPSACSWIDRCHTWPPPRVIDDIIRRGCHFVAIGHKLGKHADNEWRISFSQAEQKLVYSMNHTQFLTYGLLKLFVKEFNKGLNEDEKLLCSYHMKTAIFWAIQQNTIAHWCPQNLLAGFWVCFKLLLMWVCQGVCPNFFIPENNMFLNKVYGVAQQNLFTRLYGLYEKGIAFLLQIPSINPYIINVLCNPRLSVCTNDNALISEYVVDADMFSNMAYGMFAAKVFDKDDIMECINFMEQLIKLPLKQYQITTLQRFVTSTLQICAFTFHDMYINTLRVNKYLYVAEKMGCYMLKWAAKFGCVSDSLHMAMFFYKTFRHREALSVIEMTKVKLTQPGLMWGRVVNATRYIEAVGGMSWPRKMRHAVAFDIVLNNHICYINELTPEQQSGAQTGEQCLRIPPHVLLYMLEFLCYRHINPMRAEAALDDLQVLVHHDHWVPVKFRDISWEILGICHEMAGNHQAALHSYRQSLGQLQTNQIHTATRQRIRDLH